MKRILSLGTHRAVLTGLILLCISTSVQAVTRNVPAQYPNIQAVINAASGTGDTILVGTGVYKGVGNVNLDTLHKAVIIKSLAGAGSCVLDGEGVNSIFNIHSGELKTTVINGFTIQHGYGFNHQDLDGGGIYIW